MTLTYKTGRPQLNEDAAVTRARERLHDLEEAEARTAQERNTSAIICGYGSAVARTTCDPADEEPGLRTIDLYRMPAAPPRTANNTSN